MNKLLTTVFGLGVACVTALALAQTPPATAPVQAPTRAGADTAGVNGPKSLEAKIAQCIGCHSIVGYKGTFPEVYRVPMIAGQNAKYIAAALNAYKTGDRKHPTMRSIATVLSDQDITDISAYYEALGKKHVKPAPAKLSREPSPQITALLNKAQCASCHGANFSTAADPSYPKIAGQYADYLFVALKQYKTENNATSGRNNGIMGAIAKQYSNAELKALSEYVGSLETEMATVPQPRFHRND